MITNICPACGYPTLEAALCAFCCPAEVPTLNQGFVSTPLATTPTHESAWLGVRDSDSYSTARLRVRPEQVAS